jgi:threonine/homoserine/homoserine lactone efflux protein
MSIGLQQDALAGTLLAIIGGCAFLGIIVFGGYAILFSTSPMIALYTRMRRWIEGGLCALFTVAGLKLIASQR